MKLKLLRTKLFIYFLAVTAVPMLVVGFVAWQLGKQIISDGAFNNLSSLATQKVKLVDEKFNFVQLQQDTQTLNELASSEEMQRVMSQHAVGEVSIDARQRLVNLFTTNSGYREIFLIDFSSGEVIVSDSINERGTSRQANTDFQQAKQLFQSNEATRSIYFKTNQSSTMYSLSVPVTDLIGHSTAILGARLNHNLLNNLIGDATSAGKTASVQLVSEASETATTSRFTTDSNQLIDFFYSARTAANSGAYTNDGDETVYGAQAISSTGELAVIVETERGEVLSPLNNFLALIFIYGITAVAVLTIAIIMFSKTILRTANVSVRNAVTEKGTFRPGHFSSRRKRSKEKTKPTDPKATLDDKTEEEILEELLPPTKTPKLKVKSRKNS